MIKEPEVFLRPWNLSCGTPVVAQLPHNLTRTLKRPHASYQQAAAQSSFQIPCSNLNTTGIIPTRVKEPITKSL